MKVDVRLPLPGPIFAHDCNACIFLGHYESHDLYYCPDETPPHGTVIARWSGKGPDYASGIEFGKRMIGELSNESVKMLRVAYLLAADLGYVPFIWESTEVWPEVCKAGAETREVGE